MQNSIITAMLLLMLSLHAQTAEPFRRKYLMRADATVVSGYMINEDLKNVYLNGNAEYYFDERISIRGSGSYLLGSAAEQADGVRLKDFHSLMLGGVFHLCETGYFDPYVIVQPGIAYTSSCREIPPGSGDMPLLISYSSALSPLATVGLGANYYFQRFGHLFLETRYVHGNYFSEASPLSLAELRVTFGLGFNLFALSAKERSRRLAGS